MPNDMTDLRARLADALREHRRLTGDRCLCKWDAPDDPEIGHWEHLAGVLLAEFDIRERITIDTSKDFELPWA